MIERLRPWLRDLEARALLVVADHATDPDVAPFLGPAHLRRCLLVVPVEGEVRLGYFTPMEREEAAGTTHELLTPEDLDLARWEERYEDPGERLAAALGQAFLRCGIAPGRIALAGHAGVGEVFRACRILEGEGYRFVEGHALVRRVRRKKTAAHLAEIRAAAAGTCAAFRQVAGLLAGARPLAQPKGSGGGELEQGGQPLTVGRIRSTVAAVLAKHGLEQPDGNIVAPGEEGAVPHSAGTDSRVLKAGESLIVDLFPRRRLFADCTRTFCVGKPSPDLQKAHGAVLEALRRAHEGAVAGARGADLQEATKSFFQDQGYPCGRDVTRGYVHGLGHGVGFELHEAPSFRPKAPAEESVLAAGDVFTLEPGLYDPEAGYGVRLEDLVALGPEGLENLTPLPYDLDPRAWQ